jgi:hypothetical protein
LFGFEALVWDVCFCDVDAQDVVEELAGHSPAGAVAHGEDLAVFGGEG